MLRVPYLVMLIGGTLSVAQSPRGCCWCSHSFVVFFLPPCLSSAGSPAASKHRESKRNAEAIHVSDLSPYLTIFS